MKILLIGSTQYQNEFQKTVKRITNKGHEVKIPVFDDRKDYNELDIMKHNLELMKWADEIHIIWDARSIGTLIDWGMAFALEKPIFFEYLEPKRMVNFMLQYEKECQIEKKI